MNEQFLYNRPQFPAQINWSHPSTKGLVGCWLFNENGGMQAWDSSPYGTHLTLQGFTTNRRNTNGILYAGAQYCSKTVANYRSGDSSGAIGTWFRSSSTANAQTLFASCDTGTDTSFFFFYVQPTNGKVTFSSRNAAGTSNRVAGTTNVCDGKLHYIVATSSGTVWSIFVDGIAETLTEELGSNTGDWFADVTLRDNITIGAATRTSNVNLAIAEIGFTTIYSRQMLQPEARSLYLAPYAMFVR